MKARYIALFAVLSFAVAAYFRSGWADAFETLGLGVALCLLFFSFRD